MPVVKKIYLKDQNNQEVPNDIGADASNVDYTPTGSSTSTTVKAKIDEYNQHAAKKVGMQNSSDQGAHGLRYNATMQTMQYQDANNAWQDIPMGGGATQGVMLESDYAVSGAKIVKAEAGGTGNTSGYIRAGQVDLATPGTKATAEGNNVNAKGVNSHAEGDQTVSIGLGAHAEGQKVAAIGNYSHAEGFASNAVNPNNLPDGIGYVGGFGFALGAYSHAEGEECQAAAPGSHAEGQFCKTGLNANYSHVEGIESQTIGPGSHAEGSSNAYGERSHAEGSSRTGSSEDSEAGMCAHAEGFGTEATGLGAHSEGVSGNKFVSLTGKTIAEGFASHAEGLSCRAEGDASHAEGQFCHAEGESSHAGGKYTKAEGDHSFVQGVGDSNNLAILTGEAAFGIINAARSKFNNSDSDGCRFTIQTTPPENLNPSSGLDAENGIYFEKINNSDSNQTTFMDLNEQGMYLLFITAESADDSHSKAQKGVYFISRFGQGGGVDNIVDPIIKVIEKVGDSSDSTNPNPNPIVTVSPSGVFVQIEVEAGIKMQCQMIRIA